MYIYYRVSIRHHHYVLRIIFILNLTPSLSQNGYQKQMSLTVTLSVSSLRERKFLLYFPI